MTEEKQSEYVPTNPIEKASLAFSKVILSLPKKVMEFVPKKKVNPQSTQAPGEPQTMTIESAKGTKKPAVQQDPPAQESSAQSPQVQMPQKPKVDVNLPKLKFNKKIVVGLAVGFVIILIVVFVLSMMGNGNVPIQTDDTDPTPTPTPVETEVDIPSIYSKDPLILELKEDADVLDQELGRVQLRESTLVVPSLDFDLNFEK